ncbi:MAG: hypothetical protein HC871_10650 [Rhizobiales bacterium]|nr:hypothetical protein [Hyphomicrobiales bacterium]
MDALTANLPIIAELGILLVAIGFAIQQIRSINKLQRARAEREAAAKAVEGETSQGRR